MNSFLCVEGFLGEEMATALGVMLVPTQQKLGNFLEKDYFPLGKKIIKENMLFGIGILVLVSCICA